ncbi:MAG: replicative DNA helicase, partial [Gammaproteobacteria bacterium]
LMLNNTAWDEVVEIVRDEDFYNHQHRAIFQAMLHLVNKSTPIDILTVTEALKAIGGFNLGDYDNYLLRLLNETPSVANIVAYANIVRERSVLRQLIGVSNDIAGSAFSPAGRTCVELLDEAERKIFSIAEQGTKANGPILVNRLAAKAVERIDALYHSGQTMTGLSSGFTDLDKWTAGLQASELIIVAARPSMGKTAFALNIAEHAAISRKEKKLVLLFSMEMSAESLAMRMYSSLGRIELKRLRTGQLKDEDWPRISQASELLADARLFIDDTPALTPNEMRARARRLAKEHGQIGLIVVDYLQLMQIPGLRENRVAEISEISRSLKILAKELKVPVVALSQLNRSLEQRPNKRPIMSDLRDSGAIEQDADLIMFIYRDEVYNPETADKGKAEIIIAKQRDGETGTMNLTFLGQYTRFDNHISNQYSNG